MAMAQTKIFPWFFDLDNGRMVIDARWFDHVGIPRGDCSMSPGIFFDMLHPDDRETLSAAFAKQLSGILTPEAYAYRVRRCDGTWEWFEGQSVYLGQAHDGSPYRVVGICQSIQPHKEIEGHLREARDKARENDRLKSAFLANMSHEIRTPLNAIIGFANLLTCDDVPFSETERQEYSRLITANGDQLLRLISDILDLSKIESNTMEFCFGEHSLHTLLSDIYQSQLLTMPPQVELRLELPQADTTIRTDASRLKQVVNNLINNAAKFTDKGNITFGYRTADGAGATPVRYSICDRSFCCHLSHAQQSLPFSLRLHVYQPQYQRRRHHSLSGKLRQHHLFPERQSLHTVPELHIPHSRPQAAACL